ncbi:RICIN domain-containing protein [Spirosoma foliorum]|uniref:RICIN domain-containing protein n=1 Tax=Spirosoma foliorum TaxID=2710596 RepID=A0A7G5GPK2_9BACT|nr:RICIN domain-containing protein [Spirosoma foliorum]QMW00794.1 RICIN domain-containing protein [Spirosoma foliorum]
MNTMYTYMPKLYAISCGLFSSFLCLLGSQTTVLGLSLPSATVPFATLSSPNSVSVIDPSKCYRLVSRLSGKVLSVDASAQNDGDKLNQRADLNQLTQGWRFTTSNAGYYSITILNTQKGIEVTNSSTADDALLEQWTYWGGNHQQWRLVRNADGYYNIINRNSNKAITVRNSSTADGAQISQMTLGTGQEQQWSIEERSCTATATTNQAPVVVATSTSLTGTSPLSVTFTGNKSYDPDGDPITYEWNFGDGSSYATEANPVKVFTAKAGSQGVGLVLNYTVQLTVIDSKGLRSPVQTFYVKLNNNNPTVKITSPVNNAKYPLDKATSYTLGATVAGNSIQSQIWQIKLRHNNREQLVKTTSGANPVVDISPAGCDGDDYYYVISVKVTDYNNLSGQDSVKIYPDCNSPKLNITGLTATTLTSNSVRLNWTNPTLPFDKVLVVGMAGSGLTDIPLEPNYTASSSFTGTGSVLPGGGKVLFQGTSTSVVVTDLTAGQPYYFRVYAHSGNGWSGGVQVSTVAVAANRPPVAVATTTSLTGSAPLSVTFTGDKSYDPDGDNLSYEWSFSDGTVLYGANQVKVFYLQTGQHGSGVISTYTAQLTAIDTKGLRTTSQVFTISLNSTATIKITSPVNNGKYPLDKATSFGLTAAVTNGSTNPPLWQVKLRRGTHEQLIKTTADNTIAIPPVGCDGVDTYYLISVTATAAGGGYSVTDSVKIYPDCNSSKLNVTGLTATTLTSSSVQLNWTNPTLPFDNVLVVGTVIDNRTDIPLEVSYAGNASTSFTNTNSAMPGGGKILYQGTGNSVTVTDLTGGQLYYFQVYAQAGNGWSGGVQVSATPTPLIPLLPGSVSSVEANKCYRLISRLSGKVLSVDASAQNDGDKLTQRTDANQLTQGWRFAATDGGYYSVKILNTQKGIEVTNSSTAEDALLEQWTYWGGSHQQWRLVRNADGYYNIINRNSNKAITVRNSSTAEGAQISQMTLGTGQQQQWIIVERTCPAGARVGASELGETFKLWPNPARDHVLIDLSSAIGQSVSLQLNDLQGRSLQQTQLEAAPTEPYRFDTGQLSEGLYLIQIKPLGQSPTTLRLLIQR